MGTIIFAGVQMDHQAVSDIIQQGQIGVFRFQIAVPQGVDDLTVQMVEFVPHLLKYGLAVLWNGILAHQHHKAVALQYIVMGRFDPDTLFQLCPESAQIRQPEVPVLNLQNPKKRMAARVSIRWIGAAPIFDSGSCFGFNKLTSQIHFSRSIMCKPFRKTHEEQLELVVSFDWIDFDRFRGVEDEIRKVFDQTGDYMDEERKSAILSAFSTRLRNLEQRAFSKSAPMTEKQSGG